MGDQKTPTNTQPDKDLAAEERPTPSQAEGDLETVEQDLKEKAKEESKKKAPSKAVSS
jgi:hypothetical protein